MREKMVICVGNNFCNTIENGIKLIINIIIFPIYKTIFINELEINAQLIHVTCTMSSDVRVCVYFFHNTHYKLKWVYAIKMATSRRNMRRNVEIKCMCVCVSFRVI